jgi:AAA+ ATPase superfamily predicted ATPase
LAELLEALRGGSKLILLVGRRIGKTSLLKVALNEWVGHTYTWA